MLINKIRLIMAFSILLLVSCSGGENGGSRSTLGDSSGEPLDVGLTITDVAPSSAPPGGTVDVTYRGISKSASSELRMVLSGEVIVPTAIDKVKGSVSFVVPSDAESGPLYLESESDVSNSIWFDIVDSYVLSPPENDVVTDELGNRLAVNLILVSLKEGFDTYEEAQRIASIQGGEVTGSIPLISAWQLKLPTTTLDELRSAVKQIRSYATVKYTLLDYEMRNTALDGGSGLDWPDEPGFKLQRSRNRIVEGANLYKKHIHPTNEGKIRPVFTSVGIVESGIDFGKSDFQGYKNNLVGNIAIYSIDKSMDFLDDKKKYGEGHHGSLVTGALVAIHDKKADAGFLSALNGHHGGFSVHVVKTNFTHGFILDSIALAREGARVLNWSFGLAKAKISMLPLPFLGDSVAKTCDGSKPHPKWNMREDDFNQAKLAFNHLFSHLSEYRPNLIIVTTAGNRSTDAGDETYELPSSIKSDQLIVVGAHSTEAEYREEGGKVRIRTGDEMAVDKCATTDTKTIRRAFYSSYGDRVDIAASGVTVGADAGNYAREGSHSHAGTSFAAPVVTATVAAMLSINPNLTPREVKNLLRKSALPIKENRVKLSDGTETNFTRPLTEEDGVPRGDERHMAGARLNVEGAIQAAIDSLGTERNAVPKGDPIDVSLEFGKGDVTRDVTVDIPADTVFYKADVIFLVDVSSSYRDDITQFKEQARQIIGAFKESGVDVRIGVASFSDFPTKPYGSILAGDYPFLLDQPLTSDADRVVEAINGLRVRIGGDTPESQLEALYQLSSSSSVGWRKGAFPIIFLATDAKFHNSDLEAEYPGHGLSDTVQVLKSKAIRVYGLQAGGLIEDVVKLSEITGGRSFSLSSNSAEVVSSIQQAVRDAGSQFSVRLVKNGDFAHLITAIEPAVIPNVRPGDSVTYRVTFSRKMFRDARADYLFALRLEVIGEDVAIIKEIPVAIRIH